MRVQDGKNPTWYPLTLDIFVKFVYKVIFLFIFLEFSTFHFMSVPYFNFLFWRQLSNSTDTAAKLGCEAIPKALKFAPEIWNTMKNTQDRLIKNIQSRNFEKFNYVAHKDINNYFFHKVPLLPCIFIFFYFPIIFDIFVVYF